ncbi:phage head closure protein [Alicyclobacillus dauci]|uniref:Phage head closure protein n=1 Tax=Alicyclobacillus dauci TaxID=1475485 RepID=A0ABY6Z8N6_9BACL|nr:phage head closure protein [Alicyclobacillus dauci]WAH38616.1 phage head closure protein [Alicyclobacillus dauci]
MTTTGDLRRRVTFQKQVTVTDDEGFSTQTWQDVTTVWAAFKEVTRGKEFEASAALQVENLLDITIRYRTDITPDMRIAYGLRVLHIIEMADKSGEHEYLWFRTREVIGGG